MAIEGQRPVVTPDCRAFRLVRKEWQPSDRSGRPSSAAFTDHATRPTVLDDCMSVFLEEIIFAKGEHPQGLLDLNPGQWMCWLSVKQVEATFCQQLIDHPDDDYFPGHAVLYAHLSGGKRTQGTRSQMAAAASWYDPRAE